MGFRSASKTFHGMNSFDGQRTTCLINILQLDNDTAKITTNNHKNHDDAD